MDVIGPCGLAEAAAEVEGKAVGKLRILVIKASIGGNFGLIMMNGCRLST